MCWYTGVPNVTVDPPSQTIEITHTVKFTASVSGMENDNFSYQWRHNKEDIDGETSSILTIFNVTDDHGGNYECVVRNMFGDCATSNSSELSKGIYKCVCKFKMLYMFGYFRNKAHYNHTSKQ